MKKIYLATIAFCLFWICASQLFAEAASARKVIFFYAPGCHNCDLVRAKIEDVVESSFRDRLIIEYVNITDLDNYKLLVAFQEEAGYTGRIVFPALYLDGHFLDGSLSAASLKAEIDVILKSARPSAALAAPRPPPVDLAAHFKRLGPLVVMVAGLVDGINPCAFSAMVFFISFLTVHGYDKKRIEVSGLTFIGASFVTYMLIGVGLLGSLYALKYFSAAARVFNISIGVVSIAFGVLSLYDAVRFARTGSTDSLILRLSSSLKYKIQSAIGKEYRVSKDDAGSKKKGFAAVLIGACTVGAVVSIFESACTGQVYLPTITFVLNASGDKFLALLYIFLYNVMFSTPLCVIFLCALAGATSQNFENFIRRHMVKIKIGLAVVFFALGALLIIWYVPAMGAETAKSATPVPVTSAQPVNIQTPAKLVPDQYYWDFGTVREGKVLVHKFTVKNDTAQEFTIKQVNTSCSCTTSKLDKWTLAPGESTTLEVTFSTKGYPGERQRFVYLHTNRVPEPMIMLEVRAEIK